MKATIEGYYTLRGGDFTNAGASATELKAALQGLGYVPSDVIRRAAVSAFEAEMNVIIHAVAGTLSYELTDSELRITVRDIGPGIPDVKLAMQEGYTTAPDWARQHGWGNGQGLPNIEKNVDSLEIDTVVGEGTTLELGIKIPRPDGSGG